MNATNELRTSAGHLLENKVPPPLVVAILSLLMGGITWLTPPLDIALTLRLAVGIVVIAVGASIVVRGARTFWRAGTTIDPVNIGRVSAFVTSGIFGYTRNPMYVGFTTMLIGWGLILASPWAMLGPVAFVLFTTRFQIIPEERAMQAKFGKEYDEYRARVRRWL
jgi:protein-S-isoprenylcysteine O-methyltransferase Ste14